MSTATLPSLRNCFFNPYNKTARLILLSAVGVTERLRCSKVQELARTRGRARIWTQAVGFRSFLSYSPLKNILPISLTSSKIWLNDWTDKKQHIQYDTIVLNYFSPITCLYLLLIVSVHKETSRMLIPKCWQLLFSGDRICRIFVGFYFLLLFFVFFSELFMFLEFWWWACIIVFVFLSQWLYWDSIYIPWSSLIWSIDFNAF